MVDAPPLPAYPPPALRSSSSFSPAKATTEGGSVAAEEQKPADVAQQAVTDSDVTFDSFKVTITQSFEFKSETHPAALKKIFATTHFSKPVQTWASVRSPNPPVDDAAPKKPPRVSPAPVVFHLVIHVCGRRVRSVFPGLPAGSEDMPADKTQCSENPDVVNSLISVQDDEKCKRCAEERAPDEDVPVEMGRKRDIRAFLKNLKKDDELLQPRLKRVLLYLVGVKKKPLYMEVRDVAKVADILVEKFPDTVVSVAGELIENLVIFYSTHFFTEIISSPDPRIRSHPWVTFPSTIRGILQLTQFAEDAVVLVEPIILKVVEHILLFKILFQYLTIDTGIFLDDPARLQACVDVCRVTLEDCWDEISSHVYAGKLIECIILHCRGATLVEQALPAMLEPVFQRLAKCGPFYFEDVKEHLLVVLMAAIWVYKEHAIRVLHRIARHCLDYTCEELFSSYKDITGLHNRKIILFGVFAFLNIPKQRRPAIINRNLRKIMKLVIFIFDGLQKEMKIQAKVNNTDSEGSDTGGSEVESGGGTSSDRSEEEHLNSDEADTEDTIHSSDDGEETVEVILGRSDSRAKCKRANSSDRRDDDEEPPQSDAHDSERYRTKFDEGATLDIFAHFTYTLHGCCILSMSQFTAKEQRPAAINSNPEVCLEKSALYELLTMVSDVDVPLSDRMDAAVQLKEIIQNYWKLPGDGGYTECLSSEQKEYLKAKILDIMSKTAYSVRCEPATEFPHSYLSFARQFFTKESDEVLQAIMSLLYVDVLRVDVIMPEEVGDIFVVSVLIPKIS
ncbi:unnamed protein product [Heligmosomoides polygyrus]|uniref:Importin N-terminal domain-containing protein n=1 Tax=Heligmosomoides polygyrus TaxID=6339 RepID=A0A3P7WZH2_HELPZ|nr:unnamed protein product [Heligmosomoides polygyrus]